MSKRLSGEDEAVFAATAHYLISCRMYHDAIQVLKVCHRVNCEPFAPIGEELRAQLDDVRLLSLSMFSESGRYWPPSSHPELAALARVLTRLDRVLTKDLRNRGVKIRTIYDFLRIVERRPTMYFGNQVGLSRLSAYLDGMRRPHPKFTFEHPPFVLGFQRWINKRFPSLKAVGRGWDEILSEAAGGDGPQALALFFRELRAYRRAHPNPALQRTAQSRRR